uniref:Uncharacterized protein n=1 Tax=Anguilla anguilla TaxID=7936 RepID=A0A0E9WIE7_ANGAN
MFQCLSQEIMPVAALLYYTTIFTFLFQLCQLISYFFIFVLQLPDVIFQAIHMFFIFFSLVSTLVLMVIF